MTDSRLAASIDIGTNSVLLLVAETDGRTVRVCDEQHAVPRLGRGVDKNRSLHPESVKRVLTVLNDYKAYLQDRYPDIADHVMVTATSAVRDAANRGEFLKMIEQDTGWNVRLLSGEEEAQFTYRGAISVLPPSEDIRCVLDIGGGSTEIAFGRGSELMSYISLDIGSVRFSERYLLSDPPGHDEMDQAAEAVRAALANVKMPPIKSRPEAVGVAGTVTSVAAIKAGHSEYRPEKLNNSRLEEETIKRYIGEFASIPADQIEQAYPVFLKGRGDVIVGGLIILQEFLRWQKLDFITVSTGGIRHGALLNE